MGESKQLNLLIRIRISKGSRGMFSPHRRHHREWGRVRHQGRARGSAAWGLQVWTPLTTGGACDVLSCRLFEQIGADETGCITLQEWTKYLQGTQARLVRALQGFQIVFGSLLALDHRHPHPLTTHGAIT